MSLFKRKRKRILISAMLCSALLVTGCKSEIEVQATNDSVPINAEDVQAEEKSITISFGGDVTMGNYIGSSYAGTFDDEIKKQGDDYSSYVFKNVKDIFEKDDITIVNLEGPLTESVNGDTNKKFAFKGSPSYVDILKEGSIEGVSIANNHSEDYFKQGLEDTKKILDENDIEYSGMGEKTIFNVDGVKIGFLAYNGWSSTYSKEYLDDISSDIKQLKEESDAVIVYYHWGVEGKHYPNQIQKDYAYHTIDSGADLVIGSHPHVLQGIEQYKGKYIAYSLGNFSFGGNKNPSDKDTMIYQQTFNFKDGKLIGLDKPTVIPCSISSSTNRNNYQPTPLYDTEGERVMDKIKEISMPLN